VLVGLLACRPDPPPREVEASCAPAGAAWATCSVRLPEPGPAEVRFGDGAESVRFVDAAATSDHTIPIWGLTPSTSWTWDAEDGAVSGAITTDALPEEVDLEVAVTGGPTLSMVLLPAACGTAGFVVALDAAGRVRWYADFRGSTGELREGILAAHLGDDGTVAVVLDLEEIVRADLTGRVIQRISPDRPVHHDVVRKDGLTWTLLAEAWAEPDGNTYVEDVVAAYDDAGTLVQTWAEHDHLDPTLVGPADGIPYWHEEFPGAIDAWHTNGLFVGDDGGLLLSLLHVDSVLRVDAGEPTWVVGGGGVLPSDMVPVGNAAFHEQHHPALLDNGHLTVFDNSGNRGLELALDPAGGTATFVADWRIPTECGVQGSVFPLDDGHRLVTC
jgi:hypothetical protein